MLEYFPDEILLHVFEYFDIRDLYDSFYGLNSRLNSIICAKKNLSIVFSSPDDMNDSFCDAFTNYIAKLVVDHSSYIDFQAFPSLHSLILNSPSDDQLEQISYCKFPYLVHLEFGIMSNTLAYRTLYEILHSQQFPCLKTCIFHHETNVVSLNRYRQIWSNSSTLRTVWLSSVDLSLRSNPELLNQAKILSTDVKHLHLKRLDICCTSDGPSIIEIDHFLYQMPNLEKFNIASNEVYYSYEFLQQLASILNRRLRYLNEFHCELLCLMTNEELEQLPRLHACFKHIQCESKYGGQCIRLFTE
ncbi:unnamed protein product [Adineta ricciae]|uniref:F-box domain-containing protein n=1 Tax=Adineta ricciae TaxID=249248 RepID=A0A815HAT3_ADIRI|nr:unnamed protein product [Adineta ricciae]CAF1351993.1 unnamed protein product [Adineta ricciae]